MSKSTGNSILPKELFTGDNDFMEKGFSPSVVRFFMMQAHYRSVLDFSNDAILAAEKGYNRINEAITLLDKLPVSQTSSFSINEWKEKCYAAMNDDFNTPILVAELFEGASLIQKINSGSESINQEDLIVLQQTFRDFFYDVLGLKSSQESLIGDETEHLDKAMQLLIDLRAQARANRDFATSDKIRDQLLEAGIQLKDGPDGTTYTL